MLFSRWTPPHGAWHLELVKREGQDRRCMVREGIWQSDRRKANFSSEFSESVRMHPNASRYIKTYPNASKQVQAELSKSPHSKNFAKIARTSKILRNS